MSPARQKKSAVETASSRRSSPSKTSLLRRLIGKRPSSKQAAQKLLREHSFHDTARVVAAIGRLYEDELQRRNLAKVFGHLIRACEKSADPDRALVCFE